MHHGGALGQSGGGPHSPGREALHKVAAMTNNLLAELRRHNLLRTLVQRQVIAEAVAEAAIDAEQLAQAHQQFRQQNGLEDTEALEQFLASNGLTDADLAWQVEQPLRINSHVQEHYRHKAEAHFLSRKNQLDRVVYSLLRVKDRYLASELYLRIEAQEANFADLAAQFAEGPERQTNGIVGPVPLTQAHPALAERLRTTSPGVLMQPFSIADWWLVARLESYTPASFNEEMASQMSNELFDQWVRQEADRRMVQLSASGVSITAA